MAEADRDGVGSDREILDEERLARLVVEGYGELQGAPITLDVLPSEVKEEIPEDGDLVVLSYYSPGANGRLHP